MIDAEISGMLSTVAVTSRSAYSFLSAGASAAVCPMMLVPDVAEHRLELFDRQVDAVARNGLELVERAAGVAEPSTRHLRHDDAACRRQRRQHDRDLVANAAGAVLPDLDAWNIRQIDPVARPHHGVGEPAGLLIAHPLQHDRHQERRRLIVGHRAIGDPAYERFDVGLREAVAVAFAGDDVDETHARRQYKARPRAKITFATTAGG